MHVYIIDKFIYLVSYSLIYLHIYVSGEVQYFVQVQVKRGAVRSQIY
jgi:hypothetical protein